MTQLSLIDDRWSFDPATWDPQAYAACYYPPDSVGPENEALIVHQIAIWRATAGRQEGPRDLVLIGGGGMMWDVAAAAPHVRQIWYCDPMPANRDLVSRFLSRRGASAWDRYIAATLSHERGKAASESDVRRRCDLMRRTITRITECDINRNPPLPFLPDGMPSFAMHFVAESLTNSQDVWRATMANLAAVVPPGSHFLLSSLVRATRWRCSSQGDMQPAVCLERGDIEALLASLGFTPFYSGFIRAEERNAGDYAGLLVTASLKTG